VELNRDLLGRSSESPEVDRHLALQDHMAGEDLRERDFSSDEERGSGKAQSETGAKVHDENLYIADRCKEQVIA
jgi:hypothetical protein